MGDRNAKACESAFVRSCVASRPSLALNAAASAPVAVLFLLFAYMSWNGLIRITLSQNTWDMLRHSTWPGLASAFTFTAGRATRAVSRATQTGVQITTQVRTRYGELLAYLIGLVAAASMGYYFSRRPGFVTFLAVLLGVVIFGLYLFSTAEEVSNPEAASDGTQGAEAAGPYKKVVALFGGAIMGAFLVLLYYMGRFFKISSTNAFADILSLFVLLFFAFALLTWYGSRISSVGKRRRTLQTKRDQSACEAADAPKKGAKNYQKKNAASDRTSVKEERP